jgi:formate dehydrogenase beta subunit
MAHNVQQVREFDHPGEGRRRAKSTPKGRQIDPTAAHEIEQLLGDRPRRRDLLIEHLHLIQDRYHQISAAHLAALADEMKLSFAEVFETATFYAHFDIVKEGEPDIPPITIRVCDSLTCAMMGAEKLLRELQDQAGPGMLPARRGRHVDPGRVLRGGRRNGTRAQGGGKQDGEAHDDIPLPQG